MGCGIDVVKRPLNRLQLGVDIQLRRPLLNRGIALLRAGKNHYAEQRNDQRYPRDVLALQPVMHGQDQHGVRP